MSLRDHELGGLDYEYEAVAGDSYVETFVMAL